VGRDQSVVSGGEFAALLEGQGFDFFAGVPCSLIEDLIAELERHPRLPYIAAAREDAAVGLAGGAWFVGRRPAVLMQNSGLGTSLNALASFSLMYGIPTLLIVTWRGYQGKDAPEHILMGEISPRLLELLGIPFRVPSAGSLAVDLAWAVGELDARQAPVALVIRPGVVATGGHAPAPGAQPRRGTSAPAPPRTEGAASVAVRAEGRPRPEATAVRAAGRSTAEASGEMTEDTLIPKLSRREALALAIKEVGDVPVIHANGYMCRESASVVDRPQNFYMIGSMGLASAIGLGMTLGDPSGTAIVFDGDGNLLMNLGILSTVACTRPRGFIHCVFDNEVYGSTGSQQSPSRDVRLDRLARAAGYRTVRAVTEPEAISAGVRAALATDGPHFILVKVTTEEAEVPRITHTPAAIRDRFRKSVGRA